MIKIEKVTINGLRGIKNRVTLESNSNSILLYGENGSGKSSITDAFEWFYMNRIDHLSSEEIGRGGLEALRNIFREDGDTASFDIQLSNNGFNSQKSISFERNSLHSQQSNESDAFKEYLKESQKENLILRHNDLMDFILSSKREKLKDLSGIIGFSQVSHVRELLRRTVGDLAREYKKGNFENEISSQQARLIDYYGSNITSDEQFFAAVNHLITPLGVDKKITAINQMDSIRDLVKKDGDSGNIELQSLFNKLSDWAASFPAALDIIEDLYNEFYQKYLKISGDINKMNKILLEKLLAEGMDVIKKNAAGKDLCPLCLQPKNHKELMTELDRRHNELGLQKKEIQKLDELRESLKKELQDALRETNYAIPANHSICDDNPELIKYIHLLESGLENYLSQSNIQLSPNQQLNSPAQLLIARDSLKKISGICIQKSAALKASSKEDLKFDILEKLVLSKDAFLKIKELKKRKKALEHQQESLQLIYDRFLRKQKQGLETFFSRFSKDIDELYQYMNPSEKVDDLKLVPIEKDGELMGITFDYKFFNSNESPPHKYLSESHLNCLGIAFFLASVKAFNKQNKFFILDDVISSFDESHKKRFARLLWEKMADFQVIILTHEKEWFHYLENNTKTENWLVNSIKWSEAKGTHFAEPTESTEPAAHTESFKSLKSIESTKSTKPGKSTENPEQHIQRQIQRKLQQNETKDLAKDIRKYFQHILKHIAYNLELKMKFRFNDSNEERALEELLGELTALLKKSSLKAHPVIEKVSKSLFIGIGSTGNAGLFEHSFAELKDFLELVEEFKHVFYCDSCGQYTTRSKDPAAKRLACTCGTIVYEKPGR
ncbi:MAG: hypothetical protein GY757_02455 [bacterium]|nr:hypothetical protein [bacterium]